MLESVNTKTEAPCFYLIKKLVGDGISFRNDIVARLDPQALLKIHKLAAVFVAFVCIDVVLEHQGELFITRPSHPILWRRGGFFIDRPDVAVFFPFDSCDIAAREYVD